MCKYTIQILFRLTINFENNDIELKKYLKMSKIRQALSWLWFFLLQISQARHAATCTEKKKKTVGKSTMRLQPLGTIVGRLKANQKPL